MRMWTWVDRKSLNLSKGLRQTKMGTVSGGSGERAAAVWDGGRVIVQLSYLSAFWTSIGYSTLLYIFIVSSQGYSSVRTYRGLL